MAAVHSGSMLYFKILTTDRMERFNVFHYAKIRGHGQTVAEMSLFSIFKMAAIRHLGF